MNSIQIFDPAMCCSTGLCGVDVDQALVSFAADVDWLKSRGVEVARVNLAQQPQEFADNDRIRDLLQTQGEKALPAVLVDGELMATGRFPSRAELMDWAALPADESVFSEQVAELVAIGAAIAANCEPCLKHHYDKARRLGVSAADMRSAVALAQKVKETPARAMMQLADRLLDDQGEAVPAAGTGECCGNEEEPENVRAGSGCC